jgi:hypothetical protein
MSCEPAIQLWLPFGKKGEQIYAEVVTGSPSQEVQLMECVVEQDNMVKAYKHVKRNGGSPGIDGMTVEELGPYLREHWPELREALLAGTYEPQPVKRVNIPKPGGGTRKLGVPTAVDRLNKPSGPTGIAARVGQDVFEVELWFQARTQRPSGAQVRTKASEKWISVVRGYGSREIFRSSEPRQAHE